MNPFERLKNQSGFILEVLLLSTVLSFLIKYGGSTLSTSVTPTIVLAIVFMPTLVMVIALFWRSLQAH
jgi:hypothetical protein